MDASAGIISVQDLLSKKPVQVKISSDSQLHKLPSRDGTAHSDATERLDASGNARRGRCFRLRICPGCSERPAFWRRGSEWCRGRALWRNKLRRSPQEETLAACARAAVRLTSNRC